MGAELKYCVGSYTLAGLAGRHTCGFRTSHGGPSGCGFTMNSTGAGGIGLKVIVWVSTACQITVSPVFTVRSFGAKSNRMPPISAERSKAPARTNQNVVPFGPGSLRTLLASALPFSISADRCSLSAFASLSISLWPGTSLALAGTTSIVPCICGCSAQAYRYKPGLVKVSENSVDAGMPGTSGCILICPEFTNELPSYFSGGAPDCRVGHASVGFRMNSPGWPPGTGTQASGRASPGAPPTTATLGPEKAPPENVTVW